MTHDKKKGKKKTRGTGERMNEEKKELGRRVRRSGLMYVPVGVGELQELLVQQQKDQPRTRLAAASPKTAMGLQSARKTDPGRD